MGWRYYSAILVAGGDGRKKGEKGKKGKKGGENLGDTLKKCEKVGNVDDI